MKPWRLLDRALGPDGTPLLLYARDGEFLIVAGGQVLMSSRTHGSEQALAEQSLAALHPCARARVLLGGLGCGYTLSAALRGLAADATVTVAELLPEVVAWNRGPMAHLAGSPLDDRRVTVVESDVVPLIRGARATFDLILLDVDNGPSALTQAPNAWLYRRDGVRALWGALRPGGVLGVWSAGEDAAFRATLAGSGFRVQQVLASATASRRGCHHVIWVATKDSPRVSGSPP